MNDFLAARSQMALSLGFHIVYACIGMVMPFFMAVSHYRWLRTGDIFVKDKDGFYYFRSRVDDMFSCGGENVYPKEVENLLFGHPDVVNAVVTPVPHQVKGLAPAAMVMVREGSGMTADQLKAYCLDKGPAYSHPRFIDIVPALPLNGAGKVDRGIIQATLTAAYGGSAKA